MMERHQVFKDLAVDGAKASPLVGYATAVANGWTVGEWAAFAALVYSLMLIVDKARQWGLFRWMKGVAARFFR
ncbi:MAG TPA: hypothetical protein VIO94_16030 [Phenylobacterium sp.]